MVFLGRVHGPERFKARHDGRVVPPLGTASSSLEERPLLRIRVEHHRPILHTHVLPLPVQGRGIVKCEVGVEQHIRRQDLLIEVNPKSLLMSRSACAHLFIRGMRHRSPRIHALCARHTTQLTQCGVHTPEAPASQDKCRHASTLDWTPVPRPSSVPARGYAVALFAAFFFGSNGTVAKVAMSSGITPEQLTFFRCAITAILAGVTLLVVDRDGFRLGWRDFGSTLALGIVGIAFVQWFYAMALTLLPVGVVLLIEYTAVLLVALVARFVFKEAVRDRLWWAIGLVLIGLATVAAGDTTAGGLNLFGVLFAAAGALSYAGYFLLAERQVGRRHPMSVTFWSMLWSAVLWALPSRWWETDFRELGELHTLGGSLSALTPPLWVPLMWACTMGSFVPFLLSYTALKYMPATLAGIIASSEIIWAFLVAWLWLGETLGLIPLLGVITVVAGILLAQTARPKDNQGAYYTGPITLPVPLPSLRRRRSTIKHRGR